MKIAIISDAHDHRENLNKALNDIKSSNIDHILHLWDYWAPWLSVKPLVNLWIPVTGIWGNNDWEKRAICNLFSQSENCNILWTVYWSIELDWKKIFMVHYHDLHETIAKSGMYDLVLYGHNHKRYNETIWNTIICNPWAICWNKESASYAIYDTSTNEIVHKDII